MQETPVRILGQKDPLETPVFSGFPCGSAGNEAACDAGDLDAISGLGRSPGEGKRRPTPVFWPGKFQGLYHPSEKAMAPHSSTLAWKIPWMEEPGGLQSMGSLRVGHD